MNDYVIFTDSSSDFSKCSFFSLSYFTVEVERSAHQNAVPSHNYLATKKSCRDRRTRHKKTPGKTVFHIFVPSGDAEDRALRLLFERREAKNFPCKIILNIQKKFR